MTWRISLCSIVIDDEGIAKCGAAVVAPFNVASSSLELSGMQVCLSLPVTLTDATAFLRSLMTSHLAVNLCRCVSLRFEAAELFHARNVNDAVRQFLVGQINCNVIEINCPPDRQQFAQAAQTACDIARNVKASSIVIGFASPHEEPPDTALLAELSRIADQQGIAISVDVAAARDVMRRRIEDIMALNDRRLGIAVDTGNYLIANPTSNIDVMLQRNIHQLQAVIVRDAPANFAGNSGDEVLPLGGDGMIDYARVAQLLRDVSFAGPCILDLSPNLGGSIDGSEWLSHPHFADAIKHLEICGWFPKKAR